MVPFWNMKFNQFLCDSIWFRFDESGMGRFRRINYFIEVEEWILYIGTNLYETGKKELISHFQKPTLSRIKKAAFAASILYTQQSG